MRVIFAAGGSGGHVFPALSAAEELKRISPETEIVFLGRPDSLEERLVKKAGGIFYSLPSAPLRGRRILQMPAFLVKSITGVFRSFLILRRLRPALVAGFGGYASGPAVAMAALLRIPVILHEQNVVPGKANAFLHRFADVVALSFPETEKHLRPRRPAVITGNPVRSGILRVERAAGQREFGFGPDRFTILILGGSGGARTVNDAAKEMFGAMEERERSRFQVLHLTGKKQREEVEEFYHRLGVTGRVFPFLDDMASAYAASDLVVGRAGATTIAEICCRALPSILIPYPHAGSHQHENARWLEAAGAAVVLEEGRGFSAGRLKEVILRLSADGEGRRKMAAGAGKAARPDAAARLAKEILKLTSSK